MSRRLWTDEEEQFLSDNFDTMTTKELSKHIDRSEQAIRSKIRRMGLKDKAKKKAEKAASTRAATATRKSRRKKVRVSAKREGSTLPPTPSATAVATNELDPSTYRENVTCRKCWITDGYTLDDEECRHCGSPLSRVR